MEDYDQKAKSDPNTEVDDDGQKKRSDPNTTTLAEATAMQKPNPWTRRMFMVRYGSNHTGQIQV
jgi:hypothetical protein